MKRIWIVPVFVICLVAVVATVGCQREKPADSAQGPNDGLSAAERTRRELAAAKAKKEANKESRLSREEMEEQLESLGYLSDSTKSSDRSGVTIYVPEKVYDGINLYTSAHDAVAYLADMKGNELHQWRCEFKTAFPNFKPERMIRPQSMEHWRRIYMYPNGDLLAIFENIGLIKIDRDSNLIWTYPGRCHHDLQVMEDGTIYVLSNDLKFENHNGERVWILEPTISIVNPDGTERDRIHILDYFKNSMYLPLLDKMQKTGDLLHFNTVEVFDGSQVHRAAIFNKGNILISSRKLSFIAILNPEKQRVEWALTGMWQGQHEPTLLNNGNMLVFDNRRFQDRSQVMEFNPLTQEVVWLFNGTDSDPLWTAACGMEERLPNGNTLIVETQGARALEVTPDYQVVWEFYNPHTTDSGKNLANLHYLSRIPAAERPDWLPAVK